MPLFNSVRRILRLFRMLGTYGTLQFLYQEGRVHRRQTKHTYALHTRYAQFPLWVRPNTSDISVFRQIFIEHEYSCLDDLADAGLIIDCGANVGYSSAYLLSRFRKSRIICIEPEPSNFTMLKENLKPYGERVVLIQAGVWSHKTELRISNAAYRDCGKWATQVRECMQGESGELQAVDLLSLLDESGFDRISILKMDIEGAEAIVFSKNFEDWLRRTDNLVIELHDDSMFGPASELVKNAVCRDERFKVSRSGELTVFKSKKSP